MVLIMNKTILYFYVYEVIKCSDGQYYYYKKPLCGCKALKFGGLDIIEVIGEYASEEDAQSVTARLNKGEELEVVVQEF